MAMPKLARISTVDLKRELDRRATHASALDVKRVKLAKELVQLDSEIEALGGGQNGGAPSQPRRAPLKSGSGRRSPAARTREANRMTLTTALREVLTGKTMGVTEVAEAVQKAGYKTHSQNFRTMVNITLLKRKDLFKKKGRGQYTAK